MDTALLALSALSALSALPVLSALLAFPALSSWIVISALHFYSNIYKTFLDYSNFWMKTEDSLGLYMKMKYLCNYCGND